MTTVSETTIVREITINAPAARIFTALTEPSEFVQWWGDESEYRTTSMERDLRVGGAWSTTGVGASGQIYTVEGVYRVVDPPRALEYTWRPTWGDSPETTVARFDLDEHDGVTYLRLTHSGFTDMASKVDHDDGWAMVLVWLQSYAQR